MFVNQVWGLNVWPGSNGPFWSLSYEAWYYLAFAVWHFCRGWRRLLLCGLVLLAAGPKIVVALPIWGAGVLVYRAVGRTPVRSLGLLLWGGSLMLAVVCHLFGWLAGLQQAFPSALAWSRQGWAVGFWPYSYLIGALVALHILGFAWLARAWMPPASLDRVIKALAGTSFGLYLMHYPLQYFVRALLSRLDCTEGPAFVATIYVLPLLAAMLLARGCEAFKPRLARELRRGLARLPMRTAPGLT